ncbi:MAG: AsmA family protein [Betaproteobacteria bacterium]|nr:AsmA family protein [Betaproteobacteria bacterium]
MKLLKYTFLGLTVLIVIVAAVLAYVVATFDPNQYKPRIVQAVKDRMQRNLKLEGDIKLSFWPNMGARVGGAALSERGSDREFAAVRDARVSVKLMPLFSRQIIVDAVEVKGLRANLVRYKDGKTNADDLIGVPAGAKPGPKSDGASPPVVVDIAQVVIEDSALVYTDQAAGATYALSGLNLKTGRIAQGVPVPVDLSVKAQSSKPKLNVDGTLKTRVTFDLEKRRYALQELDLSIKGDAAGISNLVASAKGDIDARPDSREFTASRLALAVTGKQAAGGLNLKLDLPNLNITRDRVSGDKITLDATLSEAKRKLVASVNIPAIEGTAQAFKAGQMIVNIDLQQEGAAIKVKLASALAGSVAQERIELPKFAAAVNVNDPKLPKNPLEASINGAALVDFAKQTANMTFATRFDESNINGRVGLARFTPPAYTFDLNIDRLDADRYMAKPGSRSQQPEQPFDLAALKGLNATGTIRIGSLKVSNVKASNVRLDIKATDGRVDVSPMAANLYQGSLAGALVVNARATPTFAVRQNLSAISIGPLLRDLADNDSLAGRGNVSLDVTTQGTTVTALKKALNGAAAVKLTDGAVKGIDIAGSIRGAKARLGTLRGEQVQQADGKQKTDFSELTATFAIRDGVARNNDLSLKSPLLRVGGEGDVNIGEDRLNYLVKASVVGTTKGQGGRELGDLQGITVPVRVTGPIGAPSYKLDFNALATEAVKQKIEQTVKSRLEERLLGGATKGSAAKDGASREKSPRGGGLQDSIKGLFGR